MNFTQTLARGIVSQNFKNIFKNGVPVPLSGMQFRERTHKHWNPKFKLLRKLKIQRIDLPDYNEDPNTMTPDQIRSRMKEQGLLPPRPWQERPTYISSTGGVFEPYIPPEGDGKLSAISLGGAKQSVEMITKKSKSMMAVRKIRQYDENFDSKLFAQEAQDIYIKAHNALAAKDDDTLHQCVTELCYPYMTQDLRFCTLRWQFLKSLEPPRVAHVRYTDIIDKENLFAQVTVRFHTQQTLAVYDRFGRLLYGSEVLAKDVLEYVVFEKHLANTYGIWRIHEKIIPDWMPAREPGPKTYVREIPVETSPTESDTSVTQTDQQKPIVTA